MRTAAAGLLLASLLCAALATAVVAHGETPEPTASAQPSCPPLSCLVVLPSVAPVASTPVAPSVPPETLAASGIVLSVVSPALGHVDGFVLLTANGEQLAFDTSGLDFDPAFPVSHIAEHQMTTDPVRVTYRVEGDHLIVIALADAAE